MNWIKGLIAKLIGKNIKNTVDGELEKFHISKAKIVAILGVILPAIGPLSEALGHPVTVPDYVYKVLAGLGLWALRDATSTPTPIP
jgi:hypothetical protein